MWEEMREMRKEMTELRTKNGELEKEMAALSTKVTYLQQRGEEDPKEPTVTERRRPTGYLEAAMSSIPRRPETERRKVIRVEERTGIESRGKKEKTKDGNRKVDGEEEWIMVRHKGARKQSRGEGSRGGTAEDRRMIERNTRIPLVTEAVVISCGEKERRKELLSKAKKSISLEELGIKNSRMRTTATGATLIEILGESKKEKADKLAERLKEFYEGEPMKVTRPTRRIDLRISGLGEDTTEDEVTEAIAKEGGGKMEEIRVGRIGWSRRGYGMVWVSCEAEVAR
ncbi:hypothetical protein X777_00101, partial [Ooceraea biroi]